MKHPRSEYRSSRLRDIPHGSYQYRPDGDPQSAPATFSTTGDATNRLLEDLLQVSEDVQAAAIVIDDGSILGSILRPIASQSRAEAIATLMRTLAETTANLGTLEQAYLKGTDCSVFSTGAGRGTHLIAVTGGNTKIGLLLFEMRKLVTRVAPLLSRQTAASTPADARPFGHPSGIPGDGSLSAGGTKKRLHPSPFHAAREWLVQRGVLYILTQAPMIAFLTGYLWRWTTFPAASFLALAIASILLPLWIRFRTTRSACADDPVHHFTRYAMFALVPFAFYDIVRIPNFYLLESAYWDRWYDFGSQISGGQVDAWTSLSLGTFVHALQGYVLGLGFYILIKNHSLRNALAYLGGFLSVVYFISFTVFAGSEPSPMFAYEVFWNHFWMAIAAWLVPKVWRSWRGIQSRALKGLCIPLLAGLYTSPFAFAFWQAALAA